MASDPDPTVSALCRYPVKGLGPERLDEVEVAPGEAFPLDRAWAIENGPGRFDPDHPRPLPKVNFLMLMRNERLATLDTAFDAADNSLTLYRDGRQVAKGRLDLPIGRTMLEQFFAAYMKDDLRGSPHIVSAPGHTFSDVAAKCVHIVNLESVAGLARTMDVALDPLRFRANVYVAGVTPWSELDWVGESVRIGDVTLEVFARTDRCAATNVDPATGARDMAVPASLERRNGNIDFGIYARVTGGGRIALGDSVVTPG